MFRSNLWQSGQVAQHAITIATAKTALPFDVALVSGIRCNWLVCLAVFMATAARDIPCKILVCYAPIMAFVASGFEHSLAWSSSLSPAGTCTSRNRKTRFEFQVLC
jgi:formate transporter